MAAAVIFDFFELLRATRVPLLAANAMEQGDAPVYVVQVKEDYARLGFDPDEPEMSWVTILPPDGNTHLRGMQQRGGALRVFVLSRNKFRRIARDNKWHDMENKLAALP